jgi:phage baseplate assembly protein W
MTTKMGERWDPNHGCIIYKYIYSPMDEETLAKFEIELKENLQYNFPRYRFQQVTIQRAIFPDDDVEKVAIAIRVEDASFSFLVDQPSMLEYYQKSKKTLQQCGLLSVSKMYGYD